MWTKVRNVDDSIQFSCYVAMWAKIARRTHATSQKNNHCCSYVTVTKVGNVDDSIQIVRGWGYGGLKVKERNMSSTVAVVWELLTLMIK